jgi:hypothetical protein
MSAAHHVRGDGHSIFPADVLVELGWPAEAVEAVCTVHESGDSVKTTIFGRDGLPVKSLSGWYSLDVLRLIANVLGVTYEEKMGRGFQARAIYAALCNTEEAVAHA